jgi:hypothetical protein
LWTDYRGSDKTRIVQIKLTPQNAKALKARIKATYRSAAGEVNAILADVLGVKPEPKSK